MPHIDLYATENAQPKLQIAYQIHDSVCLWGKGWGVLPGRMAKGAEMIKEDLKQMRQNDNIYQLQKSGTLVFSSFSI